MVQSTPCLAGRLGLATVCKASSAATKKPRKGMNSASLRSKPAGDTTTFLPTKRSLAGGAAQPSNTEARAIPSAPLGVVVTDAVHRWYQDAKKEASAGDVKQQALLGQMLMEGYGVERDPVAGREWAERAQRRGYRMSGVYCEL